MSNLAQIIDVTLDLRQATHVTPMRGVFAEGDALAQTIRVTLLDGGQEADLAGASALGTFLRENDDEMIVFAGEVSGNVVTATMEAACYAQVGGFAAHVVLTIGEQERTIFAGYGDIRRTKAGTVIDPGDIVPDIGTLLARLEDMQNATTAAGAAADAADTAAAKIDGMTVEATTLAAGSQSTAALAVVGGAYKLSLGLVKGDKGDQGIQGGQGPQGLPGESGTVMDDEIGTTNPWSSKHTVDKLCLPMEATGNPVVLDHPVEGYPLGVKVSVEPVQAGSGDPSPENVRPISAPTSVKVRRCGKNLVKSNEISERTVSGLTYSLHDNVLKLSGTTTASVQFFFANQIKAVPGAACILSRDKKGGFEVNLQTTGNLWYAQITQSSRTSGTFTFPNNVIGIMVYIPANKIFDNEAYKIQLEYGDKATEFESYVGDDYTVDLPQDFAGGEVDVTGGATTSAWVRFVMDGTKGFLVEANYPYYTYYLGYNLQSIICSHGKKIIFSGNAPGYGVGAAANNIYFRFTGLTTEQEYRDFFDLEKSQGRPVTVYGKRPSSIAKPVTPISPQTIPALDGINTMTTDAQSIAVSARKDMIHLCTKFEDRLAALEAAAANL